jgi:hypothetical protein
MGCAEKSQRSGLRWDSETIARDALCLVSKEGEEALSGGMSFPRRAQRCCAPTKAIRGELVQPNLDVDEGSRRDDLAEMGAGLQGFAANESHKGSKTKFVSRRAGFDEGIDLVGFLMVKRQRDTDGEGKDGESSHNRNYQLERRCQRRLGRPRIRSRAGIHRLSMHDKNVPILYEDLALSEGMGKRFKKDGAGKLRPENKKNKQQHGRELDDQAPIHSWAPSSSYTQRYYT